MARRPCTWGGVLALALVLSAASEAPAENIAWQYSWTANPATLTATVGTGTVTFNAQSGSSSSSAGVPVGSLAAAVQFSSTAAAPPGGTPDVFSNVPESFTATLTDGSSGLSNSVVFSGVLNGNLWSNGNSLSLTFGSPTQSLSLDKHQYSVSIVPVLSEFGPGFGAVFGLVTASNVQQTPEPSSLLLAVLGVPLAGATAWKRRRRIAAR
jgi:hypothetical protein